MYVLPKMLGGDAKQTFEIALLLVGERRGGLYINYVTANTCFTGCFGEGALGVGTPGKRYSSSPASAE